MYTFIYYLSQSGPVTITTTIITIIIIIIIIIIIFKHYLQFISIKKTLCFD